MTTSAASSSWFAVLLVLVVVCGYGVQSAPLSGGTLWQGFNYEWLRKVVGFSTPHRLGSFANVIHDTGVDAVSSSKWCANGTYHMELTPGVDGDYAHPEVFYTALLSDDPAAPSISSSSTQFQFTDNSTDTPAKHASSFIQHNFVATAGASTEAFEVVLAGFDVQMKCVGSGCNSNGAWVYHLNVSLGDCTPSAAASPAASLDCSLDFVLERGWTPSHGGGKAYNDNMEFTVIIYYSVLSGPAGSMAAVRHSSAVSSTIFGGPQIVKAQLEGPSGMSAFTTGVRSFGYELSGKYSDRGRYMEELGFHVATGGDPWSYQWVGNFASPKATTYASDLLLTLEATVIGFTPATKVADGLSATGAICEDDPFFFKCSSVHLPVDLQDTVPIQGCVAV